MEKCAFVVNKEDKMSIRRALCKNYRCMRCTKKIGNTQILGVCHALKWIGMELNPKLRTWDKADMEEHDPMWPRTVRP